ncbi:MAG: T9SS type A sorting domain-containing protein [Bacteroidetes bacterium]|jgi:agmatine deiminase|nr:T9SS type A sorting domain-containing protein [Bacteroidota bacterium]MBT6686663.1 T9SS type A sorting domain-containing protein [Bacteroidota bacterium]MBT7144095.1 T9SS type A sorting domain-containing protein [Bacteroidota bacterium]MBT7492262.1 T9SS type A sorting domain-containing protein [Bacteroidota bacterium]
MKSYIIKACFIAFFSLIIVGVNAQTIQYTMPEETAQHEGTWLQWPHNHTYGPFYRSDLEPGWIEMTRELQSGENVHIIAYNMLERNHIIQVLNNANVPLTNVDFYIHQNNDVWVRDNGPIFVYDSIGDVVILDWGFNGWGNSAPYALCDVIPQLISSDISVPYIDLSAMILEGGSIEIDGNGSLMATKSSIINSNRNPNLLQAQVEDYLTTYLDVTNFIWLDGVAGLEITDMHIDGFARFLDTTTIVTMDSLSLIYWDVPSSDINTLYNAQNAYGNSFNYIFLPLTVNNVSTTWGQNIGYKGSYVNYYIGNNAVLVPSYNDPNDTVAISILQLLYPSRNVVGIDVRNLYFGGGMTHCVTQQQPQNQNYVGVIEQNNEENKLFQNSPNPFNSYSTISFSLKENSFAKLEIYNSLGQKVSTIINSKLYAGKHTTTLIAKDFENGIYTYILTVDNKIILRKKMIVN